MTSHLFPITAVVLAASTVVACHTQNRDPKVAELEQRLADTEKQLADAQRLQSNEQAAPAPEAVTQPAAAPDMSGAKRTPNASPSPAAKTARPATPPESQKYVTTDQAEHAKAEAQRLVNEQKAINAQQAQANARLQQDVERLKPREFTLPAGTLIPVRTTSELSTSKLANGSTFDGLLESDLKSGDTVIAKAGARVSCVVVSSDPGGRVKGTASLAVAARSVVGARGNVIALKTDSFSTDAESTKKKDAVRTGIATGVGAVIGGIAGGGSGAAKGAAGGAAAGVGVSLATRGEAATIPAETLIEFHLASPAVVVMQP
jgi:hypothetical protein